MRAAEVFEILCDAVRSVLRRHGLAKAASGVFSVAKAGSSSYVLFFFCSLKIRRTLKIEERYVVCDATLSSNNNRAAVTVLLNTHFGINGGAFFMHG